MHHVPESPPSWAANVSDRTWIGGASNDGDVCPLRVIPEEDWTLLEEFSDWEFFGKPPIVDGGLQDQPLFETRAFQIFAAEARLAEAYEIERASKHRA